MKTPLGTELDIGPGHIVLDGIPAPKKGAQQPPPLFGLCLLRPLSPVSATAELLLTFRGLLYRSPFTDEAIFGVLEQTHGLHLHAKFHLNVFIVSASRGQKPQFSANFCIWGLLYRHPFADEGQV